MAIVNSSAFCMRCGVWGLLCEYRKLIFYVQGIYGKICMECHFFVLCAKKQNIEEKRLYKPLCLNFEGINGYGYRIFLCYHTA
jgi:hypothetical protein